MEQRIRLFRFQGVPVYVDRLLITLLFLLTLFVVIAMEDPRIALVRILSVVCVLTGVLLHEIGHAFVATRLEIPVEDISVHLLFGATRMAPPRNAREEILVGLGGPGINLLVAGLLVPFAWSDGNWDGPLPVTPVATAFVVNLLLGSLNLVPAFPMDGGRVFRAILRTRTNLKIATIVAVWVGRIIATGLILAPLLWQHRVSLALPLIGVVLLVLGETEYRRVLDGSWSDAAEAREGRGRTSKTTLGKPGAGGE